MAAVGAGRPACLTLLCVLVVGGGCTVPAEPDGPDWQSRAAQTLQDTSSDLATVELVLRQEPSGGLGHERVVVAGFVVGRRGRPGSMLGYDRSPDQGPRLVARTVRRLHRHSALVPMSQVSGIDWERGVIETVGEPQPLRHPRWTDEGCALRAWKAAAERNVIDVRGVLRAPGLLRGVRGASRRSDDERVSCECSTSPDLRPIASTLHGCGTVSAPTAGNRSVPLAEPGGETRETSFGDLRIAYDERVLAPRTWTTEQSAWASDLLVDLPVGSVLELCSGAGHIGLLAIRGSVRDLVQVDLDPVACTFARLNADRARPRGRVEIRNARFDEAVRSHERFVLVIADPPYLPHAEIGAYPEDPELAVDGGPDGLDLVWGCLEVIRCHLVPGGQALVQLRDGHQADAVRDRLSSGAHGILRVVECREVGGRGVLCRLRQVEPGAGADALQDLAT